MTGETRDHILLHIAFDNSFARLGNTFGIEVQPTPGPEPRLVALNAELARELGLDAEVLASDEGVAMLGGGRLPPEAQPVAMAYAGHQFGSFVPRLGDGRAILLGEVVGLHGARRDLQLKGSGRTPFSRGGDGRAALGPVLREYIVSEAMAALGIPTTRALAAVETGDTVMRDTMLPGAVLTRVASSHIRVGTFQFFAARGDLTSLRQLASYVVARHYPEAAAQANSMAALLEAVVRRQAELVARWMLVGFVHGVMNTDNCSIAGETIDYGPCAFMDAYDPATVFSSIDARGRYAYANQPGIAHWNMCRFAETLLPLLADDENEALEQAKRILGCYPDAYDAAFLSGMRAKLGLTIPDPEDARLAQDLLDRMRVDGADYTSTFRALCDEDLSAARRQFSQPDAFDEWTTAWRRRLDREPASAADRSASMRRTNPAFIPRNHLVEAAIEAAVDRRDFQPFAELNRVLAEPYSSRSDRELFRDGPEQATAYKTFCGT